MSSKRYLLLPMPQIPYYFLDVFTDQPFGGNQLMVFIDLEDQCSTATMLAMAREANLAEIAFVKSDLGGGRYGVRIFTPEYEVPFAGHPSLGTAYVISKYLVSSPISRLTLDLPHAPIPIDISHPDLPEESLFVMEQAQPVFGREFSGKEICIRLKIDPDKMDFHFRSREVNTGLSYIIVHLASLAHLHSLELSVDLLFGFLKSHQLHKSNSATGLTTSFYFVTSETDHPDHDYQGRMFCIENNALVEDAATGSANGCFLAFMTQYGPPIIDAKMEQGYAMGRKSLLHLDGKQENGHYTLRVGGKVVEMGAGQWRV